MTEQSPSRWRPKCLLRRIRSSLSLKLIAIFVGGSIGLSMLMGGLWEYGLQRHFLQTVQPLLTHYQHYLIKEVGSPPDLQRAEQLSQRWPLTIRVFGAPQHWASDERLVKPRAHQDDWDGDDAPEQLEFYWDRGAVFLKHRDGVAEIYFGLQLRPKGPPLFPLLFFALVLLAIYGFYLLTRRLFKPIQTIQAGITQIGDGQLDHRINIQRSDELGQLAGDVNKMADRIEQMMQAKRDLLLALSHELKSPLARSRVTLALMEDSDYQAALLADQLAMQQLIDDIIDAERGQSDHALSHREAVAINALVDEVIASFPPTSAIAYARCPEATQVNVDRVQIKRLLRNLIENALRYNREALGAVDVACKVTGAELYLKVSDHGPGIEAQHLERVTEAFYRADPSRERKTGGLGLGLYLCQAVVNAHQGEMTIRSEADLGTTVDCRIPLKLAPESTG